MDKKSVLVIPAVLFYNVARKRAVEMAKLKLYASEPIETLSTTIRGQKVILDSDLARIYGVPTKRLNEQVRRNAERFPADFVFQITLKEAAAMQSQLVDNEEIKCMRSQFATASNSVSMRSRSQIATLKRGDNVKYPPFAFTEHGAIMAANVLNSRQGVLMSVFIVRAFVKMREQLISRTELEKRLLQVENLLLSHDDKIRDIYEQIRPLLLPPQNQIGFQSYPSSDDSEKGRVRERRARYVIKRRRKPNPK